VLMGHSQSGSFPLESALLNPAAAKALVLVEPGSCPARYTPEQIATLAKVPILVVFGDHRDTPTGLPTLPTWQARFEACQAGHGVANPLGCNGRASVIASGISSQRLRLFLDRIGGNLFNAGIGPST